MNQPRWNPYSRRRVSGDKRYQIVQYLHAEQLGECYYCLNRVSVIRATLDHLVPISHGGSNHHGNLVMSCKECNQFFGDMPLKYKFGLLIEQWGGEI